jgi:putative two-component system response regulator
MIVDDVAVNLELLAALLKKRGYEPRPVPSGKLALLAARADPPDLLLLDMNMPEMNGDEVCKRFKADAALKDIPVLFISAMTEVADKVKAFSVGAVDYVTKPFQFDEVFARVETHLRLRRLQLEVEQYNLRLEDLVKEKVAEISRSQLATIVALAKLSESRDDITGSHIERTQVFCKVLAEKLRETSDYAGSIDDTFIENIYQAAALHDIGKVGIPDHILLKPARLLPEEFAIMKTHTLIGANSLRNAFEQYPQNELLKMGIAIARSHHERWDGSGYPDGLAGEQIPLAARIMAIADVYDALRSERPYKLAFTHEASLKNILEGSGWHFDPAMMAAFMAVEAKFAEIRQLMESNLN